MPRVRSSAAYRIAFAGSAVFALGTVMLGVVVFFAMHFAFTRQLQATVADEARTLAAEYRNDGGGELADAIAQREASRSPTRLLYAVFERGGRRLYGTLQAARPPLGAHELAFTDPIEGSDSALGYAIDLSPDQRLLVAADREWIERTDRTVIDVFATAFVGICLLGLAGGLLFGTYLRRRLRAISVGAEAIIAGDIRQRMPVGPRNDEFDQLASTLNRMLERIERLLENLRQVSSDIAHDLRTPLSNLRNRLERGESEVAADAPARAIIGEAIGRVDQVLSLFSAILRIAEVKGGAARSLFATVDVSALVADLADSYAPAFQDRGRTLMWSIEDNLAVTGDRELLAQAMINLLENAQRHTPPDALVRMTLVSANNHVCLQVVDNGPGVAKADRGRIVERFTRLDRSRSTEGYGLGLNLVDAVAQLHRGRLTFKDAAPGLVATIELPRLFPTIDKDHP